MSRIKLIFHKICNRVKAYCFYPIARVITSCHAPERNKYFCISMLGDSYGCNVKAISDYILKTDPKANIIWGFSSTFYERVVCNQKMVKLYSFSFYYHILTSKYIIGNATMNRRILHKRNGQVYLQTWHGTALKKIGVDANVLSTLSSNNLVFDAENVDVFISNSEFMSNIYKEKLLYKGDIYLTGSPRNDLFFSSDDNIKNKVQNYFSIDKDIFLLLYAPTFRDDFSFDCYDVDLALIKEYFEKKTNKKVVVVIRLHALMSSLTSKLIETFPGCIDGTFYPDMQELLYATDVLITDYSSSMFDFMHTLRPVIVYAKDYKSYERGFYIPLSDLPFIICYSNEDITLSLQRYNESEYSTKVAAFCQKLGCIDDGKASERVYNILKDYK